jgi:hypothetical protein
MAEKLTENAIMKALDWAYEHAINGIPIPGVLTAEQLAQSYMRGSGDLRDKANSLIRWQNTKATTTGFLTGLGGIITMPISVPADLAVVWYIQIRMIAAIAYMGGYDLRDDKVKTLVYVCLCGNGAKDILKEFGIALGTKLTQSAIKSISGQVIVKINQKVGFRFVTKFGEKGLINFGRAVPLVGGLIGGTFDGVSTNIIGNIARETFIPR